MRLETPADVPWCSPRNSTLPFAALTAGRDLDLQLEDPAYDFIQPRMHPDGTLYAHGSTTCLVFDLPPQSAA